MKRQTTTERVTGMIGRAVAIVALLALFACGGGDEKSPDPVAEPPTTPAIVDGQKEIALAGGTVSVDDTGSPIRGAKVEVPADALASDNETITITYEDQLPAPLNPEALAMGAKQISKVLVLKRTGGRDFGQAVRVTLPFNKAELASDAVPIVVTWDEAAGRYSPVTVRSVDRANGTLTFMTAHFSKYVVIVLDKLFGTTPPDPIGLSTDAGFQPGADGFYVHNFGSYDSPGGNCFGMAGYAAWFQSYKKSTKGAGLYSLYREGDAVREEDDQSVRELITRAYQAGNQKAHLEALNWVNDQSFLTRNDADRFTAYSIIQQLMVTKQAQILAMGVGGFFKWSKGHAVTVYAYDGTAKVFKFYDNNFPNEVVTVPWDPVNGFGSYTVKNTTWDAFAFASFNQAYSQATMEALYAGSESGWPVSHFPKINVTSPTAVVSLPGVYEVASEDNVTITGTVPRAPTADNPTAQRYVHVYLNGTRYGNGGLPIGNSDDGFSVSIPKLPSATGTDVMLLVSESPRAWQGAFTAFKQFKLRVKNSFFFTNLGFETGSLDFWASERHVWGGSSGVTPSDKSGVVSAGADPIATDLQTTLFGQFAARVNNSDPDYHISTLVQTAVVPSAANPVLRFYWAAVLEDPQHTPSEQPYIEVTVTNTTKGAVIYSKRFYTNDPTYTGWKSYQNGNWKSIPWQLVELPVAAYVGDALTLKVEAADCALGGHGGYAYLDAEE